MLFPTFEFALFFAIVFSFAWILSPWSGGRKGFLVLASYFFYGWWDWRFVSLLIISSLFNWLAGVLLSRFSSDLARRSIVVIAVIANLSLLGFFKYYNFFLESLDGLLLTLGLERDLPFMQVILPVGISFFTFQGISYVVDVYRDEVEPSRNPLDIMLYISFFPQLVAGPIVRASSFLPQLDEPPRLNKVMVTTGFLLILLGLFKKTVIANYLATDIVDRVFFDPSAYGASDLLLGIYGYAVQIYCDFSAYSDIAIGVALLLGYRLNRNFDQPYRAHNLQDFWRRWHISLSTWLRDYLYKPLGGSYGSTFATYRNLLITMLLGGIWHGAAWTFVVWGALHGGALALERAWRQATGSWSGLGLRILGIVGTFHFVCLTWIFFRAETFEHAWAYLIGLATRWGEPSFYVSPFLIGLVIFGLGFHFVPRRSFVVAERLLRALPGPLIGLLFGLGLLVISSFGPQDVAPFIYFQF